jgi:hypothetical protein
MDTFSVKIGHMVMTVSLGAGEASADVPGGGESDDVAEETRKRVENAKINGEDDHLDGEHSNRLPYVSCVVRYGYFIELINCKIVQ